MGCACKVMVLKLYTSGVEDGDMLDVKSRVFQGVCDGIDFGDVLIEDNANGLSDE
jgi:hypothetical protein